jgi:hypothetical protein
VKPAIPAKAQREILLALPVRTINFLHMGSGFSAIQTFGKLFAAKNAKINQFRAKNTRKRHSLYAWHCGEFHCRTARSCRCPIRRPPEAFALLFQNGANCLTRRHTLCRRIPPSSKPLGPNPRSDLLEMEVTYGTL